MTGDVDSNRFDRLAGRLFDGTATAEEQAEVEHHLLEDEAARERYLELAAVEAGLRRWFQGTHAGGLTDSSADVLPLLRPAPRRGRRVARWILAGLGAAALVLVLAVLRSPEEPGPLVTPENGRDSTDIQPVTPAPAPENRAENAPSETPDTPEPDPSPAPPLLPDEPVERDTFIEVLEEPGGIQEFNVNVAQRACYSVTVRGGFPLRLRLVDAEGTLVAEATVRESGLRGEIPPRFLEPGRYRLEVSSPTGGTGRFRLVLNRWDGPR